MTYTYEDLINKLKENSDQKYRSFIAKLTPSIDIESIIGVRMGALRKIAKEIIKNDAADIFKETKFYYREEKLLYSLCMFKIASNFDKAMSMVDEFTPYIDSWEVTDLLASEIKIDARRKEELFKKAARYIQSNKEYVVRLGIVIILKQFKDISYMNRILLTLDRLRLDTYYVNMAAAWLLSELYFMDKAKIDKFLMNEDINQDIKKKTQQKIRESLKK